MGGTKQRQVVLNCIRKKIQNRLRKTEKQASKQHPHSLCFSSGFQVLALNSALTSFSNRVLSESCKPFPLQVGVGCRVSSQQEKPN